MKREAIRKVVEVAVERNFITLNTVSHDEAECVNEIVTCISDGIEERNKKAIECLTDVFLETIRQMPSCTTKGENGEQRPLTSQEIAEWIESDFMALLADIDEILES